MATSSFGTSVAYGAYVLGLVSLLACGASFDGAVEKCATGNRSSCQDAEKFCREGRATDVSPADVCVYAGDAHADAGDFEIALAMYRRACDANWDTCKNAVGSFQSDKGVVTWLKSKPEVAEKALAELCTIHAMACQNLARAYRDGNGVAQDRKKAISFLERACFGPDKASSFQWDACDSLAGHYERGDGVDKDEAKAANFLARVDALKGQRATDRVFEEQEEREAAEREARRDEAASEERQQIMTAVAEGAQQITKTLTQQPLGGTEAAGGKGDAKSDPRIGGAVGGSTAVRPDPCAPCKKYVEQMSAACGLRTKAPAAAQETSQSPHCYEVTGEMHRCTFQDAPGCSKNPAWSEQEWKRMKQAAEEMRRR